ncbi:unnamed protein product [Rhodiola kirilowii]
MADSSEKIQPARSLSRSMTVRSLTKRDSVQKPYLYQPIDRSNSVKKFYHPAVEKPNHSITSKVTELCRLFESQRITSKSKLSDSARASVSSWARLPGGEDKVVVYFTSLRGVRRTYDDCYAVRMIFRGLRVYVDERDVSMDSGFRRELQRVMKEKSVALPQVFVNGRCVGGAEVIRQLFETGELAKMVEGMPVKVAGYVCQSCGDVRFVPCLNCDGSKKVFDEDEEMVKRCWVCNENGLIRCPSCCS